MLYFKASNFNSELIDKYKKIHNHFYAEQFQNFISDLCIFKELRLEIRPFFVILMLIMMV